MHNLTFVLFALATLCLKYEAKVFSRCSLVHALRKHRFPPNELADWVCLIEAESGRNTSLVSREKADGSRNWGLFQINDKHWCSTNNVTGMDCFVKCEELATNSITKASRCAKLIYWRFRGFWAWEGWVKNCRHKKLPDLCKCLILTLE